ncbi:MAG: MarR family transcriptional regulator [Streptosporangiales bacterium]|nr:MarR family transcriptional regulator [Streptosporangiales bacterium]
MESREGAVADDPAMLAELLVDHLGALRRSIRRASGSSWPPRGLTNAQIDLVRVVRNQPGISVAEAAHELRLAANTVSTLVGQLTEAEIVTRVADDKDRRVARLRLTESAAERFRAWNDERHHVVTEAIAGLPAARRRNLAKALPVLLDLVERLPDAEAREEA